jgi:hypothetical protein
MKVIKYISLYRYLVNEEQMTAAQAIRTVSRLRKMDPDCINALWTWMEGKCPDISVDGVSYTDLVDDEEMSTTRALLYLDWLKREPEIALDYMATDKVKESHVPLNEENLCKMEETAKKLGLTSEPEKENINESDITVEK